MLIGSQIQDWLPNPDDDCHIGISDQNCRNRSQKVLNLFSSKGTNTLSTIMKVCLSVLNRANVDRNVLAAIFQDLGQGLERLSSAYVGWYITDSL